MFFLFNKHETVNLVQIVFIFYNQRGNINEEWYGKPGFSSLGITFVQPPCAEHSSPRLRLPKIFRKIFADPTSVYFRYSFNTLEWKIIFCAFLLMTLYISCVEVSIFVSLPKNYSSTIIFQILRRVFQVYEFTCIYICRVDYVSREMHRQINTYRFSLNKWNLLSCVPHMR